MANRLLFFFVVVLGISAIAIADAELLVLDTASETFCAADPAYDHGPSVQSCECMDCPCSYRSCCCRLPVPNMLGDGGLLQPRILVTGSRSFFMQNHTCKVAENNSAIPMDRVALHFDTLQHVSIGGKFESGKVNTSLQEYRLLVEKTLFGPRLSADLIIPIYATSEYRIESIDSFLVGPQKDTEFGDLAFGLKWLFRETCCSAWSLGLRVEAPTSREININLPQSVIKDDVWYFTPYIAYQATPGDSMFVNFFGSYRLNDKTMQSSSIYGSYPVREATYLMVDASIGYWLFNNPCSRGLTSLAPVVELHYTTTPTEEPARLLQGISATGAVLGHTDYLNLTAGLTGTWNDRVSFGAGFAFPLRYEDTGPVYGPSDRNYRWAFMFNLNYLYGRRGMR